VTSDETARPGEMPDAQLDQLLEAASGELLEYVTSSADSSRTLTAIMAQNAAATASQDSPPAGRQVPAALEIRLRAHALASALASARDLASALAVALARDLYRDRALDRAHALALALALTLALARDLAVALAGARDLALALDDAHERALALDFDLDDARELNLDDARELALDDARDLALALDGAFASARDLARSTSKDAVDMSGADLSGAEIENLDALDGVIWTQRTTWPPNIIGQVRKHSEPIGPGVYQVHTGDVHDHHGSARV
jgi:hypothetical protein